MKTEELHKLHEEFTSLHRQFKNKLNHLKAIIEQAEEQKPKDEPLTVDPIKFSEWNTDQMVKIKTYNGRTFTALPVYLWDEVTPFKADRCLCCKGPDKANKDEQQFVRLSTDNLVVSPCLMDLGQYDQGFFPICDKCARYYPDQYTFNG